MSLVDCPNPECQGGEEVWNPSPINDPQEERTATCPTCDGDGQVEEGTEVVTLADMHEQYLEEKAEERRELEGRWG